MAAKKILMVCGDYCEDYETMVPFQALLAVGHTVHAVCPDKKAGDTIKTAIHDFEGAQTYSEKPGHNFVLNATFADVQVASYDALVIPGGRGPEYLRTYPAVVAMVKHFFETNKPVAAVCHGAQLLAGAGVLKGRTCSAYPACRVEVEIAGGTYADIAIDAAITEGNLVSAPARCACTAWPPASNWKTFSGRCWRKLQNATGWVCPRCVPGCTTNWWPSGARWTILPPSCGCAAAVTWRCSCRAVSRRTRPSPSAA